MKALTYLNYRAETCFNNSEINFYSGKGWRVFIWNKKSPLIPKHQGTDYPCYHPNLLNDHSLSLYVIKHNC